MTRTRLAVVILIGLAMAAYIPSISFAQNTTAAAVDQNQPGQADGQVPQPKGGIATVTGVDQPENCLRIRNGPGNSYDIIDCASMGQQLNITGVWTSNNWAQLADNGWVFGDQIQTDLRPSREAYSQSENYVVQEVYPEYSTYSDSYLPNYGYGTYWYGGIPLYLYNIGVWHKFHPWWRHHKHWRGNTVWNGRRDFRNNVRAGIPRNFTTNRSHFSPGNVNRFNANRFRTDPSNRTRTGQTFSTPNTTRTRNFGGREFSRAAVPQFNAQRFRSGSSNVFRSGRTFSSPNVVRGGNIGVRNFSGAQFGGGRSFSAGRSFGGGGISVGRSFGGGGGFGGGGRRR